MSKEEKKKNTNNNKPKATNKKIKEEKEIEVVEEIEKVEKIEEKKETTDKIKKIEEKTKKDKKLTKSKTSKKDKFINVITTIDEKRKIIYGFVGGLLLGLLIMMIFMPDRIATLKDGTQPVASINGENITADELYEDMKDIYSITLLLNKVDTKILNEKYEETETMTKEINSSANYYFTTYKQYYGYTEEQFLAENGFASYEEFINFLKLDYRRNLYLKDYVEKNLKDNEIQDYYDKNVFGDINCEHILVSIDDEGLSKDEAYDLAEEIIKKINNGTKWEDIQKEYKKQITYENLGYQSWDASLEKTFMDALKEMNNNSFSKEPVKTSYGYHIIYRKDQKDKPKLKDIKEDIIETLVEEKRSKDENLSYKALIELRKENKFEFSDTVLKEKYDKYCKQYK